jgi:hypothetical protein
MYDRILVPRLYGARGNAMQSLAMQIAGQDDERVSFINPGDVQTIEVSGNTLLVADTLPTRTDVNVLLPMEQPWLRSRPAISPKHVNVLSILVPFGSGSSGRYAAGPARHIASVLSHRDQGTQILFYHTTWRKRDVDSEDPVDHLEEGARENMVRFSSYEQDLPSDARIQHDVLIELQSPTVVDGILGAALLHWSGLIVLARGQEVLKGSYVTQLATISPVPLLIVQKEV